MEHKMLVKDMPEGKAMLHWLSGDRFEIIAAMAELERHIPEGYAHGVMVMTPTVTDILFAPVDRQVPASGKGLLEVGGRWYVDATVGDRLTADIEWWLDGNRQPLVALQPDGSFQPVWGQDFSQVLHQVEAS